jgi:hypothetical protein
MGVLFCQEGKSELMDRVIVMKKMKEVSLMGEGLYKLPSLI